MGSMNNDQYIVELVRLIGNRRAMRITDPTVGLTLEKVLQPTEPVAPQRKLLENAFRHLLEDKRLVAA
jgi:hypothetical protein